MNYMCEFGYVEPNTYKFLRGITNKYKQQNLIPSGSNNTLIGGISTKYNPTSTELTAENGYRVGKRLVEAHPDSKSLLADTISRYLQPGDSLEYKALTKQTPKGKIAVGISQEFLNDIDNTSALTVIGHPKYSGDVLSRTLDKIKANPSITYKVDPLTPRHKRVYERAIKQKTISNMEISN